MILLDEPSMGLAPQLVEEIFEIVKKLNEDQGVSFLRPSRTPMSRCATPSTATSWNRADVLDGDAGRLALERGCQGILLGVGGEGRRSFRDVKHYKREKEVAVLNFGEP